jgi:thioredoxin 1
VSLLQGNIQPYKQVVPYLNIERKNMSAVKNVAEKDFQKEVLESDKPVLVDFWAEWCGPCRALAPILDDLAEEYGEKATLVKVNIDENPTLADQYGIMSIPAVYLFSNGSVKATSIGVKPKRVIAREFERYID